MYKICNVSLWFYNLKLIPLHINKTELTHEQKKL